jgi:uncharacterized membrane protein YcaP (DUF421 family)
MLNLAGVVIISLSSSQQASVTKTSYLMIPAAILSTILLGTRIVMSKRSAKILGPKRFLRNSFFLDFMLSIPLMTILMVGFYDG